MKKYTLITGASSGIGRDTALLFATKGKNLILIARRYELLEELKNEIYKINPNLDVVIKSFDLTEINKLENLYNEFKNYHIETFINNAGFGDFSSVSNNNLEKVTNMLRLNIETLTILSTLYTRDYENVENAQLINLSSVAGYTVINRAVTYSATKFYVSSFTEGLAIELKLKNAKMKAKLLAPAATITEFGMVASGDSNYSYDRYEKKHSSKEMAEFLYELYLSDKTIGIVDRITYEFSLTDPIFNHSVTV